MKLDIVERKCVRNAPSACLSPTFVGPIWIVAIVGRPVSCGVRHETMLLLLYSAEALIEIEAIAVADEAVERT
jgi:hypothetical protein